jgi:hypothetical protein
MAHSLVEQGGRRRSEHRHADDSSLAVPLRHFESVYSKEDLRDREKW